MCLCVYLSLYVCLCVCVCSLNSSAVSGRQSHPAGTAGIVSAKSDPTLLPTEFSRATSAPLSKVACTCWLIMTVIVDYRRSDLSAVTWQMSCMCSVMLSKCVSLRRYVIVCLTVRVSVCLCRVVVGVFSRRLTDIVVCVASCCLSMKVFSRRLSLSLSICQHQSKLNLVWQLPFIFLFQFTWDERRVVTAERFRWWWWRWQTCHEMSGSVLELFKNSWGGGRATMAVESRHAGMWCWEGTLHNPTVGGQYPSPPKF